MPTKIFKASIISAIAAVLAILNSCSKSDSQTPENTDDRPVLAVSVEPQRAWLEKIVGDRYRIITMLPNGVNPETYEPSVEIRKDLEDATAFFMVGPLLVETNLKMTSKDGGRFIDTSDGIHPIYGTHNSCSDHRTFLPSDDKMTPDPHYWSSVTNARIMTKNMADHMMTIDPEHADEYRANYASFAQHLDSLDAAYHARLDTLSTRSFMVWHPSLSYFARDYDLHQIAVGSESKEVSLQSLKHIIDHAVDDNVKVFFHQHDFDSTQAASINGAIGSRLVSINLGDYEWEAQFDNIVNELTRQ
ncbi:MAG: zinc ABC transporter substrate-binding protein [Muribaculaceae bacterium]|nr:zinc ABC transporter substrate-binding protein [Muribaculaceae bacterium]